MKKTPFGYEKITEVRIDGLNNDRWMVDLLMYLCVQYQKNKAMLKVSDGSVNS